MLVSLVIAILCVLAVAALFFSPTPRAPKPPKVGVSVDVMEGHFNTLVANETPPALSVVAMKNGILAYSKAFGLADGPPDRPTTVDDVYHFWSLTKLFTATAVMQLVEDGKVGLDDPATKYLPGFQTFLGADQISEITVRQLLNHTSELKNLRPVDLIGWIHRHDQPPVNQVALINDRMHFYRRLANQPGKASAYSNVGYILLGAIIEVASGSAFEDFVRRRILGPLQMSNTDFVYRDDNRQRAVSGSHPLFHYFTPLLLLIHHDWFSYWVSAVQKSRIWLVMFHTDYTGPTGLIGTGPDLARFGQAFLNGGELDGQRILNAESVAAMLNTGFGENTGPDGERMGLGWH